jgi:alcohol dehydrogenase (cytochrome c)
MADIVLAPNVKTEEEGYGVVRAFDPKTLDQKWEFKMNDITWAGVLSTAGDVVFSGGREGYFFALDSRNGTLLWKIPLGGQVNSGPMSYSVNGKQFIAVAAGTSLFSLHFEIRGTSHEDFSRDGPLIFSCGYYRCE